MDVLAPTTMKNAAKCDTSCELQNPVSHQIFERNLHILRGVCLSECRFIPTPLFLSLINKIGVTTVKLMKLIINLHSDVNIN